MVKNILFVDILAGDPTLQYALLVKKRLFEDKEDFTMRHFYFRLILGIVFVACLIFSLVTMNISFAMLYLVLSIAFLASAYSFWKKDKDNRR